MSAIWQGCLRYLEAELTEQDINTFVRPLHAEESPTSLLLLAPNMVLLQQVRSRFMGRIENYVRAFAREDLSVDLRVGTQPPDALAQAPSPAQAETPAPDFGTDLNYSDRLLPKFTFDKFVRGHSNELAYATAELVSQQAGNDDYNPYLIYGGVGLGKTHLMQAIGHAILQNQPATSVVYLHCEQFVQSLISALQHNRIDSFKAYYRSVDVLLIDDIQFLAGKERSQDEFFHTFNALTGRQRQIVVTCDRYPKEIEGMEDRLKSRLGGGMYCAIDPPSTETRAAILLSKAEQRGIELPNEVAWFIAEKTVGSVRELESALSRVIMQANVGGQAIDLEFTRRCLRDIVPIRDRLLNADQIKSTVAAYYDVTKEDLDSQRRPQAIAQPRQMAMKLLHELTQMSLASIGESFGGRDHSTVLYACQKIQKRLDENDERIQADYRNLKRKLLS